MANYRKFVFANSEYYHVFNRGVNRMPIFTNRREYWIGAEIADYYRYDNWPVRYSTFSKLSVENQISIQVDVQRQTNKLVEIIAWCLMPNHFHFLLKQLAENGVSRFVSNFSNSYTKYFNTKYDRSGHLFEGPFKATYLESNEQLLHVTRYIHINPAASHVIKDEKLATYPWSSLPQYLTSKKGMTAPKIILDQFPSRQEFERFTLDQISYTQELHKIKHLIQE